MSDDPSLLLDATATFGDIPGYGQEAKAARAAYDRAVCKRSPRMVTCTNLPGSRTSPATP